MTDTATPDLLDDLRRGLGDRYDLVRLLGRGGMGAVVLARDKALDRPVALKVLPPEFAAQPDLRERFLRETRLAAGFSHPNIVPVFAVEEREGLLAFAMGFVEGESLAERVKRSGPLSVRDTVRLLQDVGYALSYAHGRGVVHRDIKPDNVMIEKATGRAMVMDFGIARTVGTAAASSPGLTRVGEVVGTPEFMSPEQASGDVVDGRSDLYSLGLVAFFAVTGRLAITGDTTQSILARQLTQEAPPVASLRADLPSPLAEAIDRLLRKDPAERFASAEALVEAIESAQLAAPDVPLPVRMLAQDFAQLGIVSAFLLFIALLLQRAALRDDGNLEIALPAVFLLAVLWGRFATSFAAARRVVEAGFSPPEILAGFGRVLDERESERARLRTLPHVLARRRKSVWVFLSMIAVALLLVWISLLGRVQVAPGRYRIAQHFVIAIAAAAMMLGVAFIGLLRNPFKATVSERLFRLFWMGPAGRALLRLAARGQGTTVVSVGATSARTTVVAAPRDGAAAAGRVVPEETMRLARLEARVEALERDRAARSP